MAFTFLSGKKESSLHDLSSLSATLGSIESLSLGQALSGHTGLGWRIALSVPAKAASTGLVVLDAEKNGVIQRELLRIGFWRALHEAFKMCARNVEASSETEVYIYYLNQAGAAISPALFSQVAALKASSACIKGVKKVAVRYNSPLNSRCLELIAAIRTLTLAQTRGALANSSGIIKLDDPDGDMDEERAKEILNFIAQLNQANQERTNFNLLYLAGATPLTLNIDMSQIGCALEAARIALASEADLPVSELFQLEDVGGIGSSDSASRRRYFEAVNLFQRDALANIYAELLAHFYKGGLAFDIPPAGGIDREKYDLFLQEAKLLLEEHEQGILTALQYLQEKAALRKQYLAI